MANDTTPELLLANPATPVWDSTELFSIPNETRLFEVTNTNASGTGSLKQAIVDASIYTDEDCCIIFNAELFGENDSIMISMDASNPLGFPKGKIYIGADLIGKRVVLDFGENGPILASNNSLQLCFNNIVFRSAKRVSGTNPVLYFSYTGPETTFVKFEKCAFLDFDSPGTTLLFGTSGASQTSAYFLNCVFVPAQATASNFGNSWLCKATNTAEFFHCTVFYPTNANGIPVADNGGTVKNSLILSETDLSGEAWATDWNGFNQIANGDSPTIVENKTTSFFACLESTSETATKMANVDYWGKQRTTQTAFGALRSAFVEPSEVDTIETALGRVQIQEKAIKNKTFDSPVCFTIVDYTCDVCAENKTVPSFPTGSFVWKTNSASVPELDLPSCSMLNISDIALNAECYDFSPTGFKKDYSAPANALVALPNKTPANGVLNFNYSTCITSEKQAIVLATNGANVIAKPFWLSPFFSAVSGNVSVLTGNNWKDSAGNILEGFTGCQYSKFELSANVSVVSGIYDDWITLESIEFVQNGENVVYKNTNGEDVTQALKDAGLITFKDSSFISNLFGDLAEYALFSVDVPISVATAKTIF